MTRKRADVVLVERGFFTSRARAQEAIAAGLVTVNGTVIRKASDTVPEGQYEGTPVDGTPVNGAQADPTLDPNSPPAPDADTSADDQSADSGSDS